MILVQMIERRAGTVTGGGGFRHLNIIAVGRVGEEGRECLIHPFARRIVAHGADMLGPISRQRKRSGQPGASRETSTSHSQRSRFGRSMGSMSERRGRQP